MPSSVDYNELLLQIKAFKSGNAGSPTVPVNVFVQEADDLYLWCQDDREQLIQAGLDWNQVSLIPACAKICREFQSQWLKTYKSTDKIKKEWETKSPEAMNLRSELQHDFAFAFRKDEQLLAQIKEIAQKQSRASLVQSLNDLWVIGRGQKPLLNAIGFDSSKLDRSAGLAPEMADLIARLEGNKKLTDESKLMRDQAYAYLKQLVDELRFGGKYKFRENPERLAGYHSDYWKGRNTIRVKKLSLDDTPQAVEK